MKVLWFTNLMLPEFAMSLGLERMNTGGWMSALVAAIRSFASDVELTVACKSKREVSRRIGGVNYVALGTNVSDASARLVNELNPDVIHLHGVETIALTLPDKIIEDARTIASIQGIIAGYCPHYTGGLSACEIKEDRNLLKEWIRHTGLFQVQKSWIEQRARRETKIFCMLHNMAGRTAWDRAWAKYLNPNVRYFEVGELLRAPFYAGRRDEGSVVRHRIYCSAAVNYPLKGGHWLLRAVAALKKIYPGVELHIAAGDLVKRPKSFSGRLRWGDYHRHLWRLINELGIVDNVKLLGSLSAEQVAQELREAEVFCLPSHCENSPNSLGEAMLMGTPSVATYVGGVPSILENGVEGQLVPSGDPAMLFDAIDRYFSDREFAKACADKAYETAVKRYDPKVVVEQLMTVYKGVAL